MELRRRNRRPGGTASAEEMTQKSGDKGTRCLLGLEVLLPGQSQLQPIELCFDAAWPSTTAPVSVHFDASGQVAINSPRAAAWEDDNLLAFQFETVHVERLQATGGEDAAPAVAPTAGGLYRLWQAVAMVAALFFGAALAVLYARHADAISSQWNGGQQNHTIWIHEAFNDAASRYTDAALLLTAPVTQLNRTRYTPLPAEAIGSMEGPVDSLCRYAAKVPARPDLADLCAKHSNASSQAAEAFAWFNLPETAAWNVWYRLLIVSLNLDITDWLRWEFGETQVTQDDDEDDTTRWVRRRHQDGLLAGTVVNHTLPEWNERYAGAQERLHTVEGCLRDMTGWAGYIADGFEHELQRGSFDRWDAMGMQDDIDRLRSSSLPFAAILLDLSMAANAILDPGASQLANLTAALTVVRDEYYHSGHPDLYCSDTHPWVVRAFFQAHRWQVAWGGKQHFELGDIRTSEPASSPLLIIIIRK
jgi:hypothetical protein